MTVRTLYSLAAAVSLALAGPSLANPNQKLADDVATRIKSSGVADGASISLHTQNGVIHIAGEVRSPKQADLIVQQALSVPGTVKVDNSMKLAAPLVVQANANEPALDILPPTINTSTQSPVPANLIPSGPTSFGMPPAMYTSHGGPHGHGAAINEPVPLAAPSMPAYDMTGPKMPAYAWPTYAPYPNYSRVAYPQAYPYNAFPFIGPFYPFPKVPMGWRSVKLEWDDGHWYLGRLSTPHDYWRVKFW